MPDPAQMLTTISWISLGVAFACSAVIAIDEIRHPQKMWIMNVVWPVTALYLSLGALVFYFTTGRRMSGRHMEHEHGQGSGAGEQRGPLKPTWAQVAMAGTHCGAGCAMADIVTEFTLFALAVKLMGSELWASYLWDFLAAWLLGVAFQYFSIKPMRDLTVAGGLWAAVKADTLSILAFQVGMYAWMALVFFRLFAHPHLHPNQAPYWLMMQVGMVCGFLTTLPMNYLLVRVGWKEAMG